MLELATMSALRHCSDVAACVLRGRWRPLLVSLPVVAHHSLLILLLLLWLEPPLPLLAQEPAESEQEEAGSERPGAIRIHLVQPGETLTSIALLYDTTVAALQQLNNINDPSLLYAGQELLIPGGEGEAVLAFYTIRAGDTLAGLAAAFGTTATAIAETNHLVNPGFLVAGQSLAVVSHTGSAEPNPLTGEAHLVRAGDTPLSLAARYSVSTLAVALANELPFPLRLYPGQRLRLPAETPFQFLPGEWRRVEVRPLPAVQGETVVVYVESLDEGRPSGRFAGQPLRFVPQGDGYVALVGLDAFTEPGLTSLTLAGSGSRPWPPLQQPVTVVSGNYGTQLIQVSEDLAALLAPEVRTEEDAFFETIFSRFGETQQWQGSFQMPVTTTVITAGYGAIRSYNGGPFDIFHTGIDFGMATGATVMAAAPGEVLFSDELPLRGNTIIIDHGLGVMTGYFHLSALHVTTGDFVAAGQTIGEVGSTGLSSGPHLHWDVRIMNAPVNGLQWTREVLP
jgi:murein DD-endopeptidase MepM/ murein hydrolase activator NlpD